MGRGLTPSPRSPVRLVVCLELRTQYGRGVLNGLSEALADLSDWQRVAVEHVGRLRAALETPATCLVMQQHEPWALELAETRSIFTLLTTHQGPAVLPPCCARVAIDNQAIARLSVEALSEIGLRRVAVVDHARSPHGWGRIAATLAAARERGMQTRLVRNPEHDPAADWPPRELARDAADETLTFDRWLDQARRKLWGLVGYDDYQTSALYPLCQQAGLRIPQDVAMIGVNNDPSVCEFCQPTLSSVDPSPVLVGRKAGEVLRDWVRGRPPGKQTMTVPPRGVAPRGSTDAIGVEDPLVADLWRQIRGAAIGEMNLQQVLAAAPMSRRQIERRFREVLGCSPAALARREQVRKAKHLLTFTDLPITQVSQRAGYSAPSRFSEAFRRAEGVTPQAYRRRLR